MFDLWRANPRPSLAVGATIIVVTCLISLNYSLAQQRTEEQSATENNSTTVRDSQKKSSLPEALTTKPAIVDPTTSESFQKFSVGDQFEELRKYRSRLVSAVQITTSQTQFVESQLKDFQFRKDQQAREPSIDYVPPRSKAELTEEKKRFEEQIPDLETRSKQMKPGSPELLSTQNRIEIFKQNLGNINAQLIDYDERKTRFDRLAAEQQKRKEDTDQVIAFLQARYNQISAELSQLNRQLTDADEKIGSLFGRNDATNDFKKVMSMVFAGLVALVIFGFFVIAIRDESIRRAIFSNESGIQFITLFCASDSDYTIWDRPSARR